MQGNSLFLISVVFLSFQNFSSGTCKKENEEVIETNFLFIDRTNYVDPHDILSYEDKPFTETQDETLNSIEYQETLETVLQQTSDQTKYTIQEQVKSQKSFQTEPKQKKLTTLPRKQTEDISSKNETTSTQAQSKSINNCSCNKTGLEKERPFLGRFVNVLVKLLELEDRNLNDGDRLNIPLSAVVTKRTLFVLNEITKGGEDVQLKHLADLDQVLSTIFVADQSRLEDDSVSSTLERLINACFLRPKDWLVTMFIVSLYLVIWLTYKGYSYSYIVYRSFLPFFIMGWFWHWSYMDQIATAKHHSDRMKNSKLPASCSPDVGFFANLGLSLSQFFLRTPDPCDEYHKTQLTDPSFEINPFIALFDLSVRVVFQPLGYVGKQVGSFFQEVISSAGWAEKVPVFLAVLAILLFLLLMMCNYEIRLPFIKIGPSARIITASPAITVDNALEDNSTRPYIVQRTVRRVHSQVQPLTDVNEDSNSIEDSSEELLCSALVIEELTGTLIESTESSASSTVEVTSISSIVKETVDDKDDPLLETNGDSSADPAKEE